MHIQLLKQFNPKDEKSFPSSNCKGVTDSPAQAAKPLIANDKIPLWSKKYAQKKNTAVGNNVANP